MAHLMVSRYGLSFKSLVFSSPLPVRFHAITHGSLLVEWSEFERLDDYGV